MELAFILILLTTLLTGCVTSGSPPSTQPTTTTVDYSNLFITDELPDVWQSASLSDFEAVFGQKLPVPAYLPREFEIKEVFGWGGSSSYTLVLISDQPVQWTGRQFRCRLAFYTEWGGMSGGFKGWEGEVQYLPGTDILSVLETKDDKYILDWENYSPHKEGYSQNTALLRLYANRQFPKDELFKIAVSVPRMLPPTEPLPSPTATQPVITYPPSVPPPTILPSPSTSVPAQP
jgi:hypothetical protein